jgi:polyisoprenoid-binding protein YceI
VSSIANFTFAVTCAEAIIDLSSINTNNADRDLRLAGFTATASLLRSDFGLLPLGADKLALSDDVNIEPQEG